VVVTEIVGDESSWWRDDCQTVLAHMLSHLLTSRRHMATAGLLNGHGFSVMVSWLNIRTKCCKACGTGSQERYCVI